MGAVATLIAAIKRPDLFKAIILIEPVIMPSFVVLILSLLPPFFKKRIPIVKKALHRPDIWESKQEAFDFHRPKRVFQKLSDTALWDYIEYSTEINANKKYTLTYSKEWEAHCYTLLPNLWSLIDKCPVPVLGIRGEESDTLLPSVWQRWKKMASMYQFVEIPKTGHLVPFENPKVVAELVLRFISDKSSS